MAILAALLLGLLPDSGRGQATYDPAWLRQAEAEAIAAPIREAGGWEAVSLRLRPWRAELEKVLAARPQPAPGQSFIARDAPLDGGDGWLLSARRTEQLLHEVQVPSTDEAGNRRYALAERALVRAHRDLAAQGIRLVVVPAPDKNDLLAGRLVPIPDGVPTLHLQSKRLFLRLLQAGVDVVDLEPAFQQHLREHPDDPLHMMRDTHWSPSGIRVAAREVAARLRTVEGLAAAEPPYRERAGRVLRWEGDLAKNWAATGAPPFPVEEHRFLSVETQDGRPVPRVDRGPVLVLGDSYSSFPYDGHFSFWAFLGHALGQPVRHEDQAGGGNAVMEHLARMPRSDRADLQAVVLLFTSCSFYENDFREIPLGAGRDQVATSGDVRARIRLLDDGPTLRPAEAAYDHAVARFRAEVVEPIEGGGLAAGSRILLATPVMRNRSILPPATWRRGQVVEAALQPGIPEDPAAWMQIQASDPDTTLDLPLWFSDGPADQERRPDR